MGPGLRLFRQFVSLAGTCVSWNSPKGKVETTVGIQNLRFYGTILLNMSVSDSVEVGQDLVLWPLPGDQPRFRMGPPVSIRESTT